MAGFFRFVLDGIDGVMRQLRERRRDYDRRFELASVAAGEVILELSREVVPIDTGELYLSGFVRKTGRGWSTIVTVGYDAGHALYVHEDLSKAHGEEFNTKYAAEIAAGKFHARRPQEKAKFLIDPIHDAIADGSMPKFFYEVVEGKSYRRPIPLFVSPITISLSIPQGGYPVRGTKSGGKVI